MPSDEIGGKQPEESSCYGKKEDKRKDNPIEYPFWLEEGHIPFL
jgi:hypothetical protein